MKLIDMNPYQRIIALLEEVGLDAPHPAEHNDYAMPKVAAGLEKLVEVFKAAKFLRDEAMVLALSETEMSLFKAIEIAEESCRNHRRLSIGSE